MESSSDKSNTPTQQVKIENS